MGKIKQGILGGFTGKVGTVVGSFWNGIFYIKGLPQTSQKGGSRSQTMHQLFFKELVALSKQLSKEDLVFMYPRPPKGMSRRNLLTKQLASFAVVADNTKSVDLADINSMGNSSVIDLPEVSIGINGAVLQFSWEAVTDYRQRHADERPVVFFANVTQQKMFLVLSPITLGASGKQSFEIEGKAYGLSSDDFSGFMFLTEGGQSNVCYNTLTVIKRPAQTKKKT